MKTRYTVLLAFLAATCLIVPGETAWALPGDSIPSYGKHGLFSSPVGPGKNQAIVDFELDSEDRAVTVVRSEPGSVSRLARIGAGGELDREFGPGGFVEATNVNWTGVAIDPQGRILVAGNSGTQAVLSRFLPDGSPDPSFGQAGEWRTDLRPLAGEGIPEEGLHPEMYAVRSLDDGTIALGGDTARCVYDYAGYQDEEPAGNSCPGQVVIRLDDGGNLVPSFGSGGIRFTSLPDRDSTVALLGDGRAVIFGGYVFDSPDGGIDSVLALRMLDSAGRNLFAPFKGGNTPGVALQGSRGAAEIDGEGRILVAAGAQIYRINALGGLDRSFGGNGLISLETGPAWENYLRGNTDVADISFDGKGRILIAGNRNSSEMIGANRVQIRSGFVARLIEDGRSDPTFSNDGIALPWNGPVDKATRRFGPSDAKIEVENSGRIVIAGSVPTRSGVRPAVAPVENGDRTVPRCLGQRPTYIGSPGPDLVSGEGTGVIYTGAGDDVIEAAADGKICAGPGDDHVGLSYASKVDLGSGDDAVTAIGRDMGKDLVFGRSGDDVIAAGVGDDRIYGGEGDDRLEGQRGDDRLTGHEGRDVLLGGAGNDTLRGGGGKDVIDAGPVARVERVYTGRTGSFRIELARFRDRIVRSTISYRLTCQDGDSYRSTAFGRDRMKLEGPRLRFGYTESANEDWFNFSTALRGRRSGSDLVGKFRYFDFSESQCWTGKSKRDQWVRFRAEPQPVLRQTARQ